MYVVTRGGGRLVETGVLEWTSLAWGRALDETSSAKVDLLVGLDCCELLAATYPWRHELAIYRNATLVWAGPVYGVKTSGEKPHIEARDLSAWWDRRLVHTDQLFTVSTDLATIFQAISDDAMLPDNTPGLFAKTSPCGVLGTRTVLAAQHKIAGSELRDLANVGIDFTVVARDVLAGGLVVPTATIGTFTDAHFINPPGVSRDSSKTNRWVVAGQGVGAAGDAVYGDAQSAAMSYDDGLLESTATDSTLETSETAQAAAASRLAITASSESIDQAFLAPGAPFTISQLVPGALCRVELTQTCLPVSGLFRLKSVQCSAGGGQERVAVTLEPVGTS